MSQTFQGGSWHASDTLQLNEESFTIQESTWCLPISFKCIPGLCYDRHARNQPYERVSLFEYGEATRNWSLFVVLALMSVMFGGAFGVFQMDRVEDPDKAAQQGVGLAAGLIFASFLLVLILREAAVTMWTSQRSWPLVASPLRFFASRGQAFDIAQAFGDRHSLTNRLVRPDLNQIEVVTLMEGAMGKEMLGVTGDYVVVHKQKRVIPFCDFLRSDLSYIFPKADISFMSCARKGRNILYFIIVAAVCVGLTYAATKDSNRRNVGMLVGLVLGLIMYLGSHRQSITFGLRNNQIVLAKIPGASAMRDIALDVVRGSFPGSMQPQIRRDTEALHTFDGYTPTTVAMPRTPNLVVFVFKYIIYVISALLSSIFLFFTCSWLMRLIYLKNFKPRCRTSAKLTVYQHHAETYTAPVVHCCFAQISSGPIHYFVSNMLAYGEDTYISILHNTSIITSRAPGVRDALYFLLWGVLFAGLFYRVAGKEKLPSAMIMGLFAFTALMQYIMRSAYVYIGDDERSSFTELIGREGHHVEFAALSEVPGELVEKVASARRDSIAMIKQHGGYIAHRHVVPQGV